MSNHEAYRAFAAAAPDLPLFMQPWYLDAVCEGGVWEVALVVHHGSTVAALPYFLKKKWGWKYVAMPKICKQLGPYLLPEYRTLAHEIKFYELLIAQLPRGLAAFEQNFNYGVSNWLPFYWQGFRQTTHYSYVLDLERPEALIFSQIESGYRQKIRAAEKKLEIIHDLPVRELHRLVGQSFERQGLKQPLNLAFLENFCSTLSAHGCSQLFFARDPQTGQVHAAVLLAWDRTTAYFLISGNDSVLRKSGAPVLLKWAVICYAKNVLGLPVFDFEGSMMRNIEQGRRKFGARQKPFFRVQREWSALWKWGKMLR